jgi:hypothetical protein
MRHRLPVALLLVAALAAGSLVLGQDRNANATNLPRPALASMPSCADADVIFRLFTDGPVYLPGQAVRVTFEVRNAGSQWCNVAGQCDEVAPVSIFDGGRMVWSDKPCLNHEWDAVKIPLAPNRPVIYGGSWRTRGVRAGRYEVRGAFLKTTVLLL